MRVKHNGEISATRHQPGTGAQGAFLRNQEFKSQTNENAPSVPTDNRFKYVYDLTTLETINLLSVGMPSYYFKQHIPSDVPMDGYFIPKENLQSQYIKQVQK